MPTWSVLICLNRRASGEELYVGFFSLELQGMAGDGLNDIELIKEENRSLCRQPAVEEQVQSGAGLKAPTNSLCKIMSVGQFVPSK